MRRTIEKHFMFSEREAKELKRKAKIARLSEAALVRFLLDGYEPREYPDERFFKLMNEINQIGNDLGKLIARADKLESTDLQMLRNEVKRWHDFQADVEKEFLRAERSKLRWQ